MHNTNNSFKILIIRNDKLGDFMLSFPVYSLLKQAIPNIEIHVLTPEYTVPMANLCPNIDNIIIDPGKQATFTHQKSLYHSIKSQQYDAVVCLYSTTRIGLICYLSRIPYRLAPATKIAQIFYNNLLKQRRSKSRKPEYEYNLDLARKLLLDHKIPKKIELSSPYLTISEITKDKLRFFFLQQNNLTNTKKLVFIHPGSGGSANNLSTKQYVQLIEYLNKTSQVHIIVTFGPDETSLANTFSLQLQNIAHTQFISQKGLKDFTQHISIADIFISGSTGPLHIAGALDIATVAFYPNRRSATSLRWKTLNSDQNRLIFSPQNLYSEDMTSINIQIVSQSIIEFYKI